jgi:hypothetical protein
MEFFGEWRDLPVYLLETLVGGDVSDVGKLDVAFDVKVEVWIDLVGLPFHS